ncbi:hypothetical protein DFA_06361 [Cavenderia fasciculata]|uniref:Uncharacterized protein n=1 Tax=Cavenderia fasciculata TaxID=261658 RepID=F4PKU0_CACFS|nr:uncharacterized protein DFA_06361 [Cavenderia fasciculata]EGG24214.1 hypothetical protein DFA_06361 [Cavenderia fasciculata]|eukprot:XP_004362065.1 hypothetical protein DFA_06361 [Cavenderia fasciculata]
MRLISTIVILLACLCNIINCSGQIDQFFMMTKFGMFFSFNTTTGQLITNQNTKSGDKYFFYAAVDSNSTTNTVTFLGTDKTDRNDYLIEYNIEHNNFTNLQGIEGQYGGFEWSQIFAYDPVHNFAALPSIVMNEQEANLTIFVWNFTSQELEEITLPTGSLNQNDMTPVASYDIETGNYYIVYCLANPKILYLVVYNMLSRKIVQDPIAFDIYIPTPQIVFAAGKLFLINTYPMQNYEIYNVDVTAKTVTPAYTIANSWTTNQGSDFDMVIGQKGTSIVLFSHSKLAYTCTTIDLETMSFHASPSYQTDIKFGYEWVSGAI